MHLSTLSTSLLPQSQGRCHTRKWHCLFAWQLSIQLCAQTCWVRMPPDPLVVWPWASYSSPGVYTSTSEELGRIKTHLRGWCENSMGSGVLTYLAKCPVHEWSSHLRWYKGDTPCLHCAGAQGTQCSLDRCTWARKLRGKDLPAISLSHTHPPKILVTIVEIKSVVRETQEICTLQVPCLSCQHCSQCFSVEDVRIVTSKWA